MYHSCLINFTSSAQVNGVQALARCTGWQVLSSSSSLGCGPVEPLGNVTGCLLASPGGGERMIAVRHSPQAHASVFVGRRGAAPPPSSIEGEEADLASKHGFREVRLDKMEGKNLLGKLELLMAALSNPRSKQKANAS